MTAGAGRAAEVILHPDLRETGGLGDIGLVATSAERGNVRLQSLHSGGIIRVLCGGSVAGLTIHVGVDALGFHFEYVRMAAFAGFMTGEGDGPRREFFERVPPIMTIAAKTLGDDGRAHGHEDQKAEKEYGSEADEMGGIPKPVH